VTDEEWQEVLDRWGDAALEIPGLAEALAEWLKARR
jgi:hypothetical protein